MLAALPVRGWVQGRLADPVALDPVAPSLVLGLVALLGAWVARDRPKLAAIPALLVLYGTLSVPGDVGVTSALGLSLLAGAVGSATIRRTARPVAATSNSGGSSVNA